MDSKSKYDTLDFYALRHLKACGVWGQPFMNFISGSPIKADLLLPTMQKLEKAGLMVIRGKKSLSDAAAIIQAHGPYGLTEQTSSSSYRTQNFTTFDVAIHADFFMRTQARLTLKGHAFLALHKEDPTLEAVLKTQIEITENRKRTKQSPALPAQKPL